MTVSLPIWVYVKLWVLFLAGVYAMARTKTLSWWVVAGVFSVSMLWALVVGWVTYRAFPLPNHVADKFAAILGTHVRAQR